jgi:hypothetical protein
MSNQLNIRNVVNVSVSAPPLGLNNYNTSNLAVFTHEVPNGSFGTKGFKSYITPDDVATDFGSNSKTFAMANGVFSQQPNILAGDGQLVVILLQNDMDGVNAVQTITFSAVPASGNIQYGDGSNWTGDIAFDADAATMQTAIRTIPGFGAALVTGDETVGFTIDTGIQAPTPDLQFRHNTLLDVANYDVFPTIETTVVGVAPGSDETLGNAVTRTKDLVQYFGVMESATITDQTQANVLAAAAVIQALQKIAFFVSYDEDDILGGGTIDLLRSGSLTQSRGLYYGDNTGNAAIVMMASYAGRLLCVDFSGSNTTLTAFGKTLAGVQPDPSMSQTIYNEAQDAGADVYANVQGDPIIMDSGENLFFDQVYNRLWIAGALQIAAFNYLTTTSTKVPQTENGVLGYKSALRAVMRQSNTNAYSAPGKWTSPVTFGNQADLLSNVEQVGFYIFSQPVSEQSVADRNDRKLPLVQIALKEAGAGHRADIQVNVNP